ncbi:MAG: adenylate/guanylate cyclase domain-containing protein [Desulfobacteraceae bacterium]|nr:adenylate/guanylate cyclase domain-containing protein [Desulfobacteraceae bacterium]
MSAHRWSAGSWNHRIIFLWAEKKGVDCAVSDIRGFTTISESLEPERLVRFMNRYLTDMTKVIMDCEGTLDKYIGDAVMAIYGAPVEQKDHAIHACNSALRMFDILYRKRDIWKIEGLPTIWIGVGINTGPMVVGNIGSEKRFSYTVMGDHVNLASRLENLTKTYGVKIIVSEYTWEKAKDHFEFRELDIVRVRGRQEPLRIFELLGKDYFTHGDYAFIPIFHDGLEAYRKCEWKKATRLFEECLALKPNDRLRSCISGDATI